jgi:ribosomal protein L29
MSQAPEDLANLSLAELEAELKRRKEEQYPADVDGLVQQLKQVAEAHSLRPRKVLDDMGKRLQTKRVTKIEDSKEDAQPKPCL